jgi:hypothetical protein
MASVTLTVKVEWTRPLGDRASIVQGRAGSDAEIGSCRSPGATASTTNPFTTSVTGIEVPLEMLNGGCDTAEGEVHVGSPTAPRGV